MPALCIRITLRLLPVLVKMAGVLVVSSPLRYCVALSWRCPNSLQHALSSCQPVRTITTSTTSSRLLRISDGEQLCVPANCYQQMRKYTSYLYSTGVSHTSNVSTVDSILNAASNENKHSCVTIKKAALSALPFHHSRNFSTGQPSPASSGVTKPRSAGLNVFDRNAKLLQRERAAARPDASVYDYLKDEVGSPIEMFNLLLYNANSFVLV